MEGNQSQSNKERQSERTPAKSKKILTKTIEFITLVRGRNCAKTIEKCLRSIRRQTYPYWRAIIILDNPTDNSEEITRKFINNDNRFYLIVNEKQFGVCKNMYHIIGRADNILMPNDNDVGTIVDADDWISKIAFELTEEKFRKYPDTLITHGSYKKLSKGKRTKISNPYPHSGNVRRLPWRGSHLKSIKWHLLKQVKSEWFKHKRQWLGAASDLALMFPLIEKAGLSRVRHIHEIIYYWNNNPSKSKRALEKKCERILRER